MPNFRSTKATDPSAIWAAVSGEGRIMVAPLSEKRHLLGSGRHHEASLVVRLGIRRYEEEPRPSRLIALGRSDYHLPILEDDADLAARGRLLGVELVALLVLRASREVPDEEQGLEVPDQELHGLAARGRLRGDDVEALLGGEEVVRDALDEPTVAKVGNHSVHGIKPSGDPSSMMVHPGP